MEKLIIERDLEVIPTQTEPVPRFKTQWNAHLFPSVGKVISQPSLTIPDQSMTMREILQRYANGLDPVGAKIPMYYGEDEQMEMDINKMDLSERYEWIAQNRIRIADMKDRLANPDKYKQLELPIQEEPKPEPQEKPKPTKKPSKEGNESSIDS